MGGGGYYGIFDKFGILGVKLFGNWENIWILDLRLINFNILSEIQIKSNQIYLQYHIRHSRVICSRPGGGTRDIYWWGCALAHQKRGVLGAGTAQKGGS